jgi:CMP-N-acetylneuraminic acid synthetase
MLKEFKQFIDTLRNFSVNFDNALLEIDKINENPNIDEQSIKDEIFKKYNIDNPIIRPLELAADDTKSIDVVLYTIEELEKRGEFYDAVCLLQPTSPFRDDDLIDKCIKKFIEHDYDALITVEKVPDEYNPHWLFEETESGYLKLATGDEKIISRRQELPAAFKRDGSIYITKTSILKSMHSFYGKNLGFIEVPIGQINIDNIVDWNRAESFIKENNVRN